MEFVSKYVARIPDEHGLIQYSDLEQAVWKTLFERQISIIQKRASDEFIDGLEKLHLSPHEIPQIPLLSQTLKNLSGWQLHPVQALISARDFFELLATKHFPVATFIRVPEELDYVEEPDIFHEIFGHCPMLTCPVYAEFVNQYAKKVLESPEKDWPLLQRLFWFTVEFGLINTPKGLRAYGGGILSSIQETPYCLESDVPMRVMFHPVIAFRTPYRIDQLQLVYFVIENYQTLYDFVLSDLNALITRARALGEFPPFFQVDANNPSIHILAC